MLYYYFCLVGCIPPRRKITDTTQNLNEKTGPYKWTQIATLSSSTLERRFRRAPGYKRNLRDFCTPALFYCAPRVDVFYLGAPGHRFTSLLATAAPQLAGPVAGPVRIVPLFESFYTFPEKTTDTTRKVA